MNAYAVIILIALLGEYLLSLVANYLNTRQLGGELPAEFVGIYDPEAYRRSQEYARARARFRVIHSTFDLAVILLFWFAGGFGWLDRLVQGLGVGPIWTGLAFIGLLALAQAVLSLPFSVYSTF